MYSEQNERGKASLPLSLLWLALGAVCFYLSQISFRIPLLQGIQNSTAYNAFLAADPRRVLLASVIIALSAGVFEEGFRFLFKEFLLKPARSPFSQPLLFGLGHGMMEAFYILLPLATLYPLSLLWPAIIERLLAIIIHIGLSFMVWNGFQTGRKWQYLLMAVITHGLVNIAIPLFSQFGWGAYIGIWVLLASLALLIYTFYSKRYYRKASPYEENLA